MIFSGITINAITKEPLRWLIKATLALGIIVFSGYTPEFKSYSRERVKTELRETSLAISKKTARFKKIHDANCGTFPESRNSHASNFISSLCYYENNIRVKLKVNVSEITYTQNQDKNFQKFYIFHNSNKSDSDNLRG